MSLDAHGAPISLGGKLYTVAPLTDKDISELDEYIRHVHVTTAVKATQGLSQEIQDRALEIAISQASELSFMSPRGASIIRSLDGVARILWQGLKHNHPDLSYEEVRATFTDRSLVKEANRVFTKLNVEPLQEVAAKGKALQDRHAQLRKKTSTSRSSKGTTSRRSKSRK